MSGKERATSFFSSKGESNDKERSHITNGEVLAWEIIKKKFKFVIDYQNPQNCLFKKLEKSQKEEIQSIIKELQKNWKHQTCNGNFGNFIKRNGRLIETNGRFCDDDRIKKNKNGKIKKVFMEKSIFNF